MLITVRCLLTRWSLKSEANAEDNCRKALCCCMTMPFNILLPTQLKPSRNSSLSYWLILHIVQISTLQTPLKEALRCRRFTSDQELKEAVPVWLAAEPKSFFWGHKEACAMMEEVHWKARGLTPWCWVLLEKPTGLQLVKKFPAFHGTRRFITALTSVRQLSLSWASPIQSIYSHPTSWRSILILSTHLCLGLHSGLFPSGFPTKSLYTPVFSPICATCPAHLILLNFITRTILGEEYRDYVKNDVIISFLFLLKFYICIADNYWLTYILIKSFLFPHLLKLTPGN